MATCRVTVPARLEALGALRQAIDGLAETYAGHTPAPSPRDLYAWGLAIYEAATNVVRHGFTGGSDEPLTLELEPGERSVCLRLIDRGHVNTQWGRSASPHASGEGGYGVPIILAVAGRVTYGRDATGANVLEMLCAFGPEEVS